MQLLQSPYHTLYVLEYYDVATHVISLKIVGFLLCIIMKQNGAASYFKIYLTCSSEPAKLSLLDLRLSFACDKDTV